MHNANDATRNAVGALERGVSRSGLVPMGTLGAFLVRDLKTGVQFSVGSGMNDRERSLFWALGDALKGRLLRYRYFPSGCVDLPRFPVFAGLRDGADTEALYA
jgi:DNA ligase-1